MRYKLITNAFIVNEQQIFKGDVLIAGERIKNIDSFIDRDSHYELIDVSGFYLLPGMIDAHVHFRESGWIDKGIIESKSMAAIAGGITSFMEMPNTFPNTTTIERLEEKYSIAEKTSYANYSFYFGLSADNLEEALKVDHTKVCGLTDDGLYFDHKGSLLCNNPSYLAELFSKSKSLIKTIGLYNDRLFEIKKA